LHLHLVAFERKDLAHAPTHFGLDAVDLDGVTLFESPQRTEDHA